MLKRKLMKRVYLHFFNYFGIKFCIDMSRVVKYCRFYEGYHPPINIQLNYIFVIHGLCSINVEKQCKQKLFRCWK